MRRMIMKKMVLFHKTPAIWSKLDYVEEALPAELSDIKTGTLEEDSAIFSLFHSDIYIRLSQFICHHFGIKELHIVQGFSEGEKRNWINGEKKGKYKIDNISTYWCVDNPQELVGFMDADLIFSRGNYQMLHHFLHKFQNRNPNQIWIHYPATAFMFPHFNLYEQKILNSVEMHSSEKRKINEQITGMMIENQISKGLMPEDEADLNTIMADLKSHVNSYRSKKNVGPYDIVLVDDESSIESYEHVYQNSLILKFTKPAIDPSLLLKYKRKYDLLFCGTTLQSTKNHMLFVSLLNRMDRELETPLRIAIAGNRGDIPAFSQGIKKQYEHIIVEDYGELTRQQLFELFNESKSLIVLSGRDCNPRIIQEAGLCGTSVIAADTMSDGLELLKKYPLLGTVIPTKKSSWFYQRNGNLLFEVNHPFTLRVLAAINAANSPFLVRKISKKVYSMEKSCQAISDQIRVIR